MLKAWTPSDSCQSWSLYQKIRDAGISSVNQLLDTINAKLPRKLFGNNNLDESATRQICKAYWDRVREKFRFGSEYEGWFVPVQVVSIEEFKAKTLQLIGAGLWKLKLNMLSESDEGVIRARLTALKEAVRLASKFREVYICQSCYGLNIRDMRLADVVTFSTKGESFERLLLGEDQVWFVKHTRGDYTWYVYFGDGNVPETLDYRVDVKVDSGGNFYIFPLDDLSELLDPQDFETIKALVGK